MIFQYPLEKLLELKLQEEKQVLTDLATWRGKFRLVRENLRDMESNYSCYIKTFEENSKLSADKFISYTRFFPVLHEGIKKEKTKCSLIQEEIDNLLVGLAVLIKERQVLEKLKEKKYQEFLLEASKKEQLQMDEIALNQYYM
ncbi:MAG: flagellar export protein FliJ [Clostridia bacterium]|nr:flagellar export protein FliJ [Clostridia bacterium]